MKRVLFVCLGNICRSPLAEAIFKHKVKGKGLEHLYYAESCGTANYHVGDPPDPRTIKNAKLNGVVIEHLGRQLGVSDFETFDEIFVMDHSNMSNARRLAAGHHHKLQLMRAFDPEGAGLEVPDPYYGTEEDFQKVFDILDRTIESYLERNKV